MTSSVLIHVLGICLIISGCGVTDPDYTNDILPVLLDYPEISYPNPTTGNSANAGYLATIAHLEDICDYRSRLFSNIQSFVDLQIDGKKVGKDIEWRRVPGYEPEQLVILSVTRGDTLRFRLDYEGPTSGAPSIDGWIHSASGSGYIDSGSIRCKWWPDAYGMNLGVRLWDPLVLGFDHVAYDSTDGGGSLSWDEGKQVSIEKFEAFWDAVGHGSWQSDNYGSGEW